MNRGGKPKPRVSVNDIPYSANLSNMYPIFHVEP